MDCIRHHGPGLCGYAHEQFEQSKDGVDCDTDN